LKPANSFNAKRYSPKLDNSKPSSFKVARALLWPRYASKGFGRYRKSGGNVKKLSVLFILSMIPMLALAQSDSSTTSTDQSSGADNCVVLSPASYDFGDVPVDFASSPAQFLLVNNGCGSNVIVTAVTATGQGFLQGNDCVGMPVSNNSFCTINVKFKPGFTGTHNQQLIVNDHLQGSSQKLQQTASLTGTGIHDVTVTPTSCNFYTVKIGDTAHCTVKIQNNEPVRLTIDSCQVSPDPPFSQSNSCPSSLAKNGNNGDYVDITVDFSPLGTDLYNGQFTIATNAPDGSPKPVALSGMGVLQCRPPHCCMGSDPCPQ
jgi:hypothetical protein